MKRKLCKRCESVYLNNKNKDKDYCTACETIIKMSRKDEIRKLANKACDLNDEAIKKLNDDIEER